MECHFKINSRFSQRIEFLDFNALVEKLFRDNEYLDQDGGFYKVTIRFIFPDGVKRMFIGIYEECQYSDYDERQYGGILQEYNEVPYEESHYPFLNPYRDYIRTQANVYPETKKWPPIDADYVFYNWKYMYEIYDIDVTDVSKEYLNG